MKQSHVDAFYDHAKLLFECGQYEQSAEYLPLARGLGIDPEKQFSAMWGKLASEILSKTDWEVALADLIALRDAIEAKVFGCFCFLPKI